MEQGCGLAHSKLSEAPDTDSFAIVRHGKGGQTESGVRIQPPHRPSDSVALLLERHSKKKCKGRWGESRVRFQKRKNRLDFRGLRKSRDGESDGGPGIRTPDMPIARHTCAAGKQISATASVTLQKQTGPEKKGVS
jgi:hypothetical protein